MKKTSISKIAVALLLALGIANFAGIAQAQPNVLFIAVDDLKPLLGCYGDEMAITPNIDSLAESGVTFLNAHCQWSICGASRASLTTSLMPEETGVFFFQALRYILPDLITLPQHFKNNGYETAAIGKIHDNRTVGDLNPADPAGSTINGSVIDDALSWSIPYDNGGSGISSSKATSADDAGVLLTLITESVDAADSAFVDGSICDKGIARLGSMAAQYESTGKPFFLGVGFKKPHMPFLAPKKYWDYYQRDDFTTHPFQEDPLNVLSYTFNTIYELRSNYYMHLDAQGKGITIPMIIPEEDQKELLHGYYACASFIDAQVGRLLDELDSLGIADDTIIVFWGDHGFHLGDHNEWGKHTNMEQATRSPLIISAPGLGTGGRTTMSPATFLDIYPTLCELASLPVPEQPLSDTQPTGRPLRGKSIVPILQDPDDSVRFGAYSHYGAWNYGYAYRTERYRYVEWISSANSVIGYELYDYKFDPYETVNIAPDADYALLVQQLSNSMRAEGECQGCERLKASDPVTIGSGASGSETIALSFAQEVFGSAVLHGTGRDTADARFSAIVDFDAFDGSAAQTIFDIGGGGGQEGLSLIYGSGNELIVTICSDWSNRVDTSYTLSSAQIAAGMLEVAVVVDIDHNDGNGTEDMIKLFVDGDQVASAVITILDNDFVNGDQSGFGMTGGNITGGFQILQDWDVFSSGTIDYSAGLWYSGDIDSAPSEPSMIVLSFAQEEFESSEVHDTGRDTADAQFSLLVDFDTFDDSLSTTVQTVFDIGGGGGAEGLSLVYGPANELILTICSDWSTRVDTSYTVSPEQIVAGMIEVSVIVDIDHDDGDGTEDLVRLFVDRIPVASAVITILDNDFVNGDQSGFGMTGGNITGGFQTTPDRADFSSGKINYAAGLWYSDSITGIEVSWCDLANLNGLLPVDLSDLALLMSGWLEEGVGLEGDIKKDGHIDIRDLSVMASYWSSDCAE